ncbi:hypothetical protein DP939_22340 [Spongiactinospora rosea]|uniref:Uncharacterized protein n=1 Tax=Spongiactinospora rosea TaxID=2248750 RepID=A0A366LX17_9ACTN|nr:hypothetical protein DP939_22340 [Spongiactinospora rosea]
MLLYLARTPRPRPSRIAAAPGVTERVVYLALAALAAARYPTQVCDGRDGHTVRYMLDTDRPAHVRPRCRVAAMTSVTRPRRRDQPVR